MKVCFDTSVVVPALLPSHPQHERSRDWLFAAARKRVVGVMSWHAVAEAWSVLTRLPVHPAISGSTARAMLARLEKVLALREPSARIYREAIDRCASRSLRSGAIFDALHLVTAEAASADLMLTWNLADFQRLASAHGGPRLVAPDQLRPG